MLQAENAQLQSFQQPPPDPGPDSADPSSSSASSSFSSALVARLRLDLAEALRSQGQFQARLRAAEEELRALRARSAHEGAAVRALTAEAKALGRKLRDREEELRAKDKMVRDVHDELDVLHMQLNVHDEKYAKLERENRQLVARFMKRVGQEAEALNAANEPTMAGRGG